MDETRELLVAIMGRLQEMGAEMKGLADEVRHNGARLEALGAEVQEIKAELRVTNDLLDKIEGRLDHLAEKWMEHDHEIYRLKRRQA